MAGNIGVAFSEIVLNVKEEEFVALEVSSFQLDFIDLFKPDYAVILNITPDHLDRYENDFQKYARAKIAINKNQNDSDYLILNIDDELLKSTDFNNGRKIGFSLTSNKADLFVRNEEFYFYKNNGDERICNTNVLQIKGEHNKYNALAVIAISKLLGLKNTEIEKELSTFPGVEHRLEFVRKINDVDFINDSKVIHYNYSKI